MYCGQCGAAHPPGQRFCGQCGALLAETSPVSAPQPRTAAAIRGAAAVIRDRSLWWLILPTILYLFLARDLVNTLILLALAFVIRFAGTRPQIPARFKPFLPVLQPVAAFVFLGGSLIAVATTAVAVGLAYLQRSRLVVILEPWWQVQERWPVRARRIAAWVVPFVLGYLFGLLAGGREWTMTFLSMITGSAAAFLLLFTPPADLRRRAAAGKGVAG